MGSAGSSRIAKRDCEAGARLPESTRFPTEPFVIDQIEKTSNIRVRTRTEVECIEGSGRVERVVLKSRDDGTCHPEDVDAVFVFIGTKP